jgi:hypothetical protein
MKPIKDNDRIYLQDQKKQVKIKGINIGGNLGPNVVIGDGSITAVNVAGGEVTGDVYKVVSEREVSSLDKIKDFIQDQDLTTDEKDKLVGDLDFLNNEIKKGEDADEGFVNFILRYMCEVSPTVASMTAEWILNQNESSNSVLVLAKEF